MSIYIKFLVLTIIFIITELLYFKIATQLNIVDKPNHRSSHEQVTIRGGGIIFSIGLLLSALFWGINYPYFLAGALLLAGISLLDDLKSVSNKIRLFIHLTAVILLVIQAGLYDFPFYVIIPFIIIAIGVINAINFMDGINGITGMYTITVLATLYYLDTKLQFINANYLITIIVSVLVFGLFNFRKKAICFAGDVGSVVIAFIMVFFLTKLIIYTHNFNYIFLLMIYGLDTFTTIIFRIIRGEKITQAHRSHFYQFLANEKKYSHLSVALLYSFAQLLLNVVLIKFPFSGWDIFALVLSAFVLCFVILRYITEGKKRLIGV